MKNYAVLEQDKRKIESIGDGFINAFKNSLTKNFNKGYEQGYRDGKLDDEAEKIEKLEKQFDDEKKAEYDRGFDEGYARAKLITTNDAYEAGYDKGYEKGKQESFEACKKCERTWQDGYSEGYAKGLQHGQELRMKEAECAEACGMRRAWDAAKKLVLSEESGGLSYTEIREIFGEYSYLEVLKNFTASEAIEKIEAWEKKQKEKQSSSVVPAPPLVDCKDCMKYGSECNGAFGNMKSHCTGFKRKQEQTEKKCETCGHYCRYDSKFKCDIKGLLCIVHDRWIPKQDAPKTNVESIEVGDEVESKCDAYSMIVTRIDNKELVGFDSTGRVTYMNIDAVKKTGNHYNIKDILDKMKKHEVKE